MGVRSYWIAAVAVIGVLLALNYRTPRRDTVHPSPAIGVSNATGAENGRSPNFPFQSKQSRPADFSEPFSASNDSSPEYLKRTAEHVAVEKILVSPARMTKEFSEIKQLVKDAGLGPSEFVVAYNAAWEGHQWTPERMAKSGGEIDEKPFDINNESHVTALAGLMEHWRSSEESRLHAMFGSTNIALINGVLNISPTVPFTSRENNGIVPTIIDGTVLKTINDIPGW